MSDLLQLKTALSKIARADAAGRSPVDEGMIEHLAEIPAYASTLLQVLDTLRDISCQAITPDWTHEQAYNWMREAAREARKKLGAVGME